MFSDVFVQTSATTQRFEPGSDLNLGLPAGKLIHVATRDLRTRLNTSKAFIDTDKKNSELYTHLVPLYHSYPFVLFSGDGGYTYLRESVKQGVKLIKQEGITHILSSYRPWSDHIVAYRLKKRFPHLVWIADFRDLPVDPLRADVWWPKLQLRFQKRLLRRADIVTTVSDGLARHLSIDHQNVVVVRNGLPQLPNGFLSAPVSPHFKITYTGSLYPHLQSVGMLLSVLRELINQAELNPAHLELHYAGKDASIWEEWLQNYNLRYLNVNHGLVSITRAAELQSNSQINLLLSWSAPKYGGIMTAKLGHYLAAGRPIITLLNGPEDPEFSQVVESTGAGFVYPSQQANSRERLRTFLLDAYRTWAFSGALPWRIDPHQLSPYTWSQQIEKLSEALKQN